MAKYDEMNKKAWRELRKQIVEDLAFDEKLKTFKQLGVIDPGEETEIYDEKKKKGGSIGRKKGGTASRKGGGGIGLTKKDTDAAKRKRKRTPAMGVTSKDVQQAKKKRKPSVGQRRRAAHQMADVEKDVTKDVKRGKKYSDIAKTISETGGLRGKIARGALALQGHIGDTTYKEAIKRGKAQGAKARKKARAATDRIGIEHMDPYGIIRKSITGEKRKGGSVKRKSGGKIMYGYKAGGKVQGDQI